MRKRIAALALASVMALSLFGCGCKEQFRLLCCGCFR